MSKHKKHKHNKSRSTKKTNYNQKPLCNNVSITNKKQNVENDNETNMSNYYKLDVNVKLVNDDEIQKQNVENDNDINMPNYYKLDVNIKLVNANEIQKQNNKNDIKSNTAKEPLIKRIKNFITCIKHKFTWSNIKKHLLPLLFYIIIYFFIFILFIIIAAILSCYKETSSLNDRRLIYCITLILSSIFFVVTIILKYICKIEEKICNPMYRLIYDYLCAVISITYVLLSIYLLFTDNKRDIPDNNSHIYGTCILVLFIFFLASIIWLCNQYENMNTKKDLEYLQVFTQALSSIVTIIGLYLSCLNKYTSDATYKFITLLYSIVLITYLIAPSYFYYKNLNTDSL